MRHVFTFPNPPSVHVMGLFSSGRSRGWAGPQRWLLAGLLATALTSWVQAAAVAIAVPPVVMAQAAGVRPTLRLGSTGTSVSELQGILALLGYFTSPVDGKYQNSTEAAVKQFQQDVGLSSDGIVGPATWAKLLPTPSTELNPPPVTEAAVAASPAPEERRDEAVELPTLRKGMYGPAVVRIQETLKTRGFYQGEIDGAFGPATEAAVMAFQRSVQLAADGVVGPATWRALLR